MFTYCKRSSVSDAHMVYETLNSCNVNSVFTPSGRFSQRGVTFIFSMAAHDLSHGSK